jgi:hypothetical protein
MDSCCSAQACLSKVAKPLLEILCEYTGLPHATLVLGKAPKKPDESFQIAVINHSKTHGPIPMDLCEYRPSQFAGNFLGEFAQYLSAMTGKYFKTLATSEAYSRKQQKYTTPHRQANQD